MEDKYANDIANDIDYVGDYRQIHGHVRFSQTAIDCRTGIVDGQRRVRVSGDSKIGHTGCHDIRLHPAKQQPQKPLAAKQYKRRDDNGKNSGEQQKLAGRFPGIIHSLASDILADHHSTAGSQGGKQIDKDGIKLID